MSSRKRYAFVDARIWDTVKIGRSKFRAIGRDLRGVMLWKGSGPTIYVIYEMSAGDWASGSFTDAPYTVPVAQQFSRMDTKTKRHIRAQQRGRNPLIASANPLLPPFGILPNPRHGRRGKADNPGIRQVRLADEFAKGATSGSASSLYIEGNRIYSYGPHFPIAERRDDGTILVRHPSRKAPSVTTAGHVGIVMGAIRAIYPHDAILYDTAGELSREAVGSYPTANPRRGPRTVQSAEKALDKSIEAAYYRLASQVQVSIMDIPEIFRDVKLELAGGVDMDSAVISVVRKYQQPGGRLLNPRRARATRGRFLRERVTAPGKFDPRSLRTVTRKSYRVVVGCPKGKYDARRKRCRVGTRAQSILRPMENPSEITFKTDHRGRKRAYYFSRSQMRWFPMPVAEAESLIAQGGAIFVPLHKTVMRPGASKTNPDDLAALDKKVNDLFRRLDAMKGTAQEGSAEYMRVLRELQSLTTRRLAVSGIKIAKPRRNVYGMKNPVGAPIAASPAILEAQKLAGWISREGVPVTVAPHGRQWGVFAPRGAAKAARAALERVIRSNGCRNPKCDNPRHGHARRNPLLQTVMLANPRGGVRQRLYEVVAYRPGHPPSVMATFLPSKKKAEEMVAIYEATARKEGRRTRYKAREFHPRNPLTRREARKVSGSIKSMRRMSLRHPEMMFQQLDGAASVLHGVRGKQAKRLHGAAWRAQDRIYVRETSKNPPRGGVTVPWRTGQKIPVDKARRWIVSTGDKELLRQFDAAAKLQAKANRSSKYVVWKTIPIGSRNRIDMVTAMAHYGDSPETYYKPPKGSKKGSNVLFRHKWGEGGGGKGSVPLLVAPSGKALIMPLTGKKVASDWLRH